MSAHTRSASFAILLLVGMTLALLPVERTVAANFTVTRFDDPEPDGCAATDCSLREAILAANDAEGPDEITVPAGTYLLAIGIDNEDSDTDASGDLDIREDLSIVGAGARLTVFRGRPDVGSVFEVHGAIAVSIQDATIRNGHADNTIGEWGGGLRSMDAGAVVTLHRVIVTENYADNGGGGLFVAGQLEVIDSLIHMNSGVGDLGIGILGGSVLIQNSTVSGHPDAAVRASELTLISSTITDNVIGLGVKDGETARFQNSIVAGNSVQDCNLRPEGDPVEGVIVSLGYNIDSDGTCKLDGVGDVTEDGLALEPLDNNGGPTDTYALPANSPAVDRVPAVNCVDADAAPLAADQRGVERPQGTACDVGAYELEMDEPSADPRTKDDCKRGGWREYGFRNQGQCIRFATTGTDSR